MININNFYIYIYILFLFLLQFRLTKWSILVHNATRNAPYMYIHSSHSGKSATIRDWINGSGVCVVLCTKTLHFVCRKRRSVACGFSPVKIDYSYYPKSFISRINEVYFSINIAIASSFLRHLLRNDATVCFTAIKLVILLAWFL